jgi:glycosyltransferase involved in cell wall biosynthesis
MPRVLIVRGHFVNPWELGPWSVLPDEYEVSYLLTGANRFDLPDPGLKALRVRTVRDVLPTGALGDMATRLIGDRYLKCDDAFAWADIVHAEELSFWFAAQAATQKRRHRFRLVQTVWETLPLLETYRNPKARSYRREVLANTDLFLPTTERAREALALEGVADERIRVCPPGIDTGRFTRAVTEEGPREHVIVSPGRLVWEKGHQDVMRAIAALTRGLIGRASRKASPISLVIVGSGPEKKRLQAYAEELGIGKMVAFRAVQYDQMPMVFAGASGMVLASLPWAGAAYQPFDVPRAFWEEQFGMVLAEAMASGLDIVATNSGAIPEVLAGTGAQLVAPGDWMGIARALAQRPLSREPGRRVEYPLETVERYSIEAAAQRLANAYTSLSS